jgi:putative ABC transport system substrate-binding protein
MNPTSPDADLQRRDVQAAGTAIGQQLRIFNASSDSDFETAFAALVQERVDALLVANDAIFTNRRDQIVALAARHAVPTIYAFRQFTASMFTAGRSAPRI